MEGLEKGPGPRVRDCGVHISFVRDFISLGLLTGTFVSWVQDFELQLLSIFLSACNSSSPLKTAECRSLDCHTNVIIIVHLAASGHKIPAESLILLPRLRPPLPPHTTIPTLVIFPRFHFPWKLDCKLEMMPSHSQLE